MKKVLIGVSAVLVLLVIVVISLPFLLDLNKYKGQIKQEVEKRIHGTFDVESLAIKGLGVNVKNLVITSTGEFKNKKLLSVGEAKIKISVLSLLTANPKATVLLKKPQIYLVKNEAGELNVTTLPKKGGDVPAQEVKEKKTSSKLPALLLGVKLSFLAENASLQYSDEKTQAKTEVQDLNISLKNISFNSPIDFNVSALLTSRAGKTSFFEGRLSFNGKAKVVTDSSRKLKGIDLDAKASVGDFALSAKGKISDINTLQTDFVISTPSLSVSKIKNSFAPFKNYNIDGTFSMNGDVKGSLKNFDQCLVNAKVNLKLTSGQTDLEFKVSLSEALSHLKGSFLVEASTLNLDEILPAKKAGALKFFAQAYAEESKKNPFEAIKNNPLFKGLSGSGKLDIKKIIFRKSELTNLSGDFDLKNLQFSISKLGLKAFKGELSAKGNFRIDTPRPQYRLTTVVQNVQTNPMLTMGSPVLKDVFIGTLNANMDLQGEGATFEDVKKYLTGNGKVDIKDAELKGLNMGEALKQKLQVISIFSGSDIFNENLESKINFIRASLVIKNGKLTTPDALLDAMPGYSAKMKGYASFDKEINYDGSLLLPAKKLSRSLASVADDKGMVAFPFTLTGVLPKFSFNVDADKVAQMAVKATFKSKMGEKIKEKIGIDLPVELPF
ncbi:MAG: AsmA family protein [Deltaproteobacteria bacterium]|nr:AsmA family protein [Deltaproteobacteria bacterium]MBI3017814.1 AsmA family protein [Deltaproteobacteria bacterium]